MTNQKNIAILAGGTSGERSISLLTAQQIFLWLQQIGYTPWIIDVQNASWQYTAPNGKAFQIDKNSFSLPLPQENIAFHAAFIATHGTPGENGLLQGYLDLMQIPYSTGDTSTQAISFHKSACKAYVHDLAPTMPAIILEQPDLLDAKLVQETLGYPLFVKPNDNGSSVGVMKVHNESQLQLAVQNAFNQATDIMIEKALNGTEVSCGMVKINNKNIVFPITELVSPAEFFDFTTKYNGATDEITPARINPNVALRIAKITEAIYDRLRCKGFARADYIIQNDTPYFLEINTIPGMTSESIIPKQVHAAGYTMPQLLALLMQEITSKIF